MEDPSLDDFPIDFTTISLISRCHVWLPEDLEWMVNEALEIPQTYHPSGFDPESVGVIHAHRRKAHAIQDSKESIWNVLTFNRIF